MLSSLVRIPTPPDAASPEDIFTSALGLIFTDDLHNSHGDPGASVIYRSKAFGDLELGLADPASEDGRKLFAHYLWNAGILMGELIGGNMGQDPKDGGDRRRLDGWSVKGETVLELGAGTGVGGIVSTLAEADRTVISDYPAPEMLANLQKNVARNVPERLLSRVAVRGHEWGVLTDEFCASNARSFTRVLAADCLWMPWQHGNLARSMEHFLSPDERARIWVVAGFHTGRAKVAAFFDVVADHGLEIEDIWEVDADLNPREWAPERDGGREDVTGRKRWLVVAILRRPTTR